MAARSAAASDLPDAATVSSAGRLPGDPVARSSPHAIPTRVMRFPFKGSDIPRHWFWNNVHATHGANALHMIFPEGERFFIRSVKHYLDRIEDPELRARVRGFFGQEGSHGHEHERFVELLREQGYDVDRFLSLYQKIAYDHFEKLAPPVLRLSVTVACEHFTASLAANALESDFLEHAHPLLRDLLRWHAAEEIEHKSVAFDVLKEVDPRYGVRIAGLAIAGTLLSGFWILGTKMLVDQEDIDPEELRRRGRAMKRTIREGGYLRRRDIFKRAIVDYLRPSFHPDDEDNYGIARAYLTRIGRADG